jgi:carboxypeptidase Taq
MGAMGYFPTYTLGNLYASQLFEKACEEMPGLVDGFARGEFAALRTWLNRSIHAHGRRFPPSELVVRVTGKPLSAEPLMRHLEGKLRPLYGR